MRAAVGLPACLSPAVSVAFLFGRTCSLLRVPVDKVILLGVGVDPQALPHAEDAEIEGGEAGSTTDQGDEQMSRTAADTGCGLVHLRDGHTIGSYRLRTGSLLYLVLEGKAAAAVS